MRSTRHPARTLIGGLVARAAIEGGGTVVGRAAHDVEDVPMAIVALTGESGRGVAVDAARMHKHACKLDEGLPRLRRLSAPGGRAKGGRTGQEGDRSRDESAGKRQQEDLTELPGALVAATIA